MLNTLKNKILLKSNFNDPITKDVVNIAWPVLLESLLGSLFSMVDMIMLGRINDSFEAAASVAAVGITNQPLFIGLAVVQALNIGGTAIVARYMGRKEEARVESTVKHIVLINLVFLVIPLCILAQVFAGEIMAFMGAEPETIEIGIWYFRIIMFGFLFQGVNNSLFAVLRGVGDTKTPMKINIKVNALNVVGNALLIYGMFFFPALGVTGAAISTCFSQIVATIMIVSLFLRGKTGIKLNLKKKFEFDKDIVKNFIRIGVPSSIEMMMLRLGIMLFTKTVAGLGTVILAAHQICLNILSLSFTTGQSFSIASASLTGRILGEGDSNRAEAYVSKAREIGSILATLIGVGFFFFAPQILGLYSRDEVLIKAGTDALRVIAIMQPFQSSAFIIVGSLRGAGDTTFPLLSTGIGILGIRVVLAYLLINIFNMGLIGAWIAVFLDQLFRWVMVYWRFKTGKWKHVKIK
ncbi:MATE family efflux transporter [Clostridium sp.]|uniref:MATE family efflux transporter n=1 Tax=Clostridium sp. TaxID=1506 RepID=UPI002FCBCC9A